MVDTPCSNTGVMRRRVDVRWRLQPAEFSRMQRQQLSILRSVLPLLRKNGLLVYSTCSLEPEENEMVVLQLLQETPGLELQVERNSLPFRNGFDGAYVASLIKST
jgi:16S rRNA (cytosine967-C5)-methyltransferase